MRIRDIAQTRMRYGYFRIYSLLCREGWIVNHKRVYRLYRENGLSLRLKRPRRHVSAAQRERAAGGAGTQRSEAHTSELQSLMSTLYADFCLKTKTHINH